MRVYRISKQAYISDLQSTGCLYESGRWHAIGTRIVYTSESAALAKLEVLAHAHRMPPDMFLAYIDIPDLLPITTLHRNKLPSKWDQLPYPKQLAFLIRTWKMESRYIGIRVPSVHTPVEYNVLLNPEHPEFAKVSLLKTEPIGFDGRFFER